MNTNDPRAKIAEYIQARITEALTGSFDDALVYGVGFIRISMDDKRDIVVEHVPFNQLDKELEKVVQHKKHLA